MGKKTTVWLIIIFLFLVLVLVGIFLEDRFVWTEKRMEYSYYHELNIQEICHNSNLVSEFEYNFGSINTKEEYFEIIAERNGIDFPNKNMVGYVVYCINEETGEMREFIYKKNRSKE